MKTLLIKNMRAKNKLGLFGLFALLPLAVFVFVVINKIYEANAAEKTSYTLASSVSKSELTSYFDQATINFTVKHTDITSSLRNGKLNIDFNGTSFDPLSFAKDSMANSNIISANFNTSSRILAVRLKDPTTTGTQFDFSVIAVARASSTHNDNLTAKATLNGQDSAGIVYPEAANATSAVKFNFPGGAFEPTNPLFPEWKVDGPIKNYSLFPGQSQESGLYFWLRNQGATNQSFRNLKIKYEKSASAEGIFTGSTTARFGGRNVGSNETRVVSARTVLNTPAEEIYEYGEVNGNLDKTVLVLANGSVPADAVAGTVYTITMSYYDEDNLIGTGVFNITVLPAATVVTLGTSALPGEVKEPNAGVLDYFDWRQRNKIETSGNGVKDYTVTLKIPEGTVPKQIAQPSNLSFIKKVEYYDGGVWTACTAKVGDVSYDLSSVPASATKLRYVYSDIKLYNGAQDYNYLFVRFANVSNMVGTNILLETEAVTYTDHTGTNRSIPGLAVYNRNVKVVNEATKAANKANANVMQSTSQPNPWNTPHFNGENIYQSVRVGAVEKDLSNPYIYMITPKGLDIASNPTNLMRAVKPFDTGFQVYTLASIGQDLIYPKAAKDIKYEKHDLGNDQILHFWSLEGLTLKGGGATLSQVMGGDVSYKINNMQSGDYDVVYGLGSLDDDTYSVYNGTPYGGLQFTNTNSQVKNAISKITSNKEFTTTKKLSIGINNSINTKMEIKGSKDADYIDATAGTATSIPGKEVKYKVSLNNTGTNNLSNFEAVEILPHVGDKLATDPLQERGSQYNVNLGSKVIALVDGVEPTDATVMYSTSNDPARFDSSGNTIGAGAWTIIPPSDLSTVKAIKVMMKLKPFEVGSIIQLEFTGTLPLDAPRNGEIAYNTIAMKADIVNVNGAGIFVSEPARGGVKSTAPATDLELSGKIYMDFDKSGAADPGETGLNGATLNLYKKVGTDFVKVDSIITAPNAVNEAGIFGFTGMQNGIYKIEAIKPNRAEFIVSGDDSFELNGADKAWLKYNNQTEFSIDDLAGGNPKKIIDFTGPIYVEGEFVGSIKFADKDGNQISPSEYVEGFSVQLQDTSGNNIGNSVLSGADGSFKISHLITAQTDYKLVITKQKTGFIYPASLNSADFDISSGVYPLVGIRPGQSAFVGLYISDEDLPTVTIAISSQENPTSIKISAADQTTEAMIEWTITKNGVQISSGSGEVKIPTEFGNYEIEFFARDSAFNQSAIKTANFSINEIIVPPIEIKPREDLEAPNTGARRINL